MVKRDDIPLDVACPHCGAPLKVQSGQEGTRCTCPKCHGGLVLPGRTSSAPAGESGGSGGSDRRGTGQPVVDGLIPPDASIVVVCPFCDTRMHVVPAQVGTSVVCPDCRKSTIVAPPRPPPKRKPKPPAEDDDPLELDTPAAADDLNLPDVHIPVFCQLCDTRMLAARSQVGTEIVCPDCRTATVVPAPPPPKKKPRLPADDDAPLELCAPIERFPVDSAGHVAEWDRDGSADRTTAGAEHGAVGCDDRVPRHAFISGILSFPFRPGSWQRWLALSLGLLLVLFLHSEAVALGSGGARREWAFSLVFTVLTFVAALIWSIVASVSCLTILQSTADGSDDIDWPDAFWIDWVFDSLYVVNALALSGLAGFGIGRLLDLAGWPHALSVPVTVFILFPILLLSMLEAVSPFSPCSLPLLRCLLIGWWAWGVVYVEAGALIALAGWTAHQIVAYGGGMGAAALAPFIVAALMVYFRLWGRLAWYCTRISAQATAADEEEDDDADELPPDSRAEEA